METEHRAAGTSNGTVVRPAYFYISGFSNVPHSNYIFVFLSFVYIVTLTGNCALLFIIYKTKALHSPKYFIVCNLALVDLCHSTTCIPKMLDTFLLNQRYVLFEVCMVTGFFINLFISMQAWTLVIMAYDRLIAICFPLRYHNLVSRKYTVAILLALWVLFIILNAQNVYSNSKELSFCRSVVLQSLTCNQGALINLSCGVSPMIRKMSIVGLVVLMVGPAGFIAVTYICIAVALIRIASAQERHKAMKTCTSHLILVAIFFMPLYFIAIAVLLFGMPPDAKMANELIQGAPALLNPIIYSLKTEEIIGVIKSYCRKTKLLITNQSRRRGGSHGLTSIKNTKNKTKQ